MWRDNHKFLKQESIGTSTSQVKCVADGMTQYDVALSAEDSVGAITTYEVSVPDPYAAVDNTPVNVEIRTKKVAYLYRE